MEVTLIHDDGSESEPFEAEEFETVNDVAYVDGVLHTEVQDVRVTA